MIKIEKPGETNGGILTILYGESGVGKTTASVENGKRVLVLDFESGTRDLAKKDNVDIIKITSDLSNFKEAIEIAKKEDYDLIIFDSITALEGNLLASFAKNSRSEMPTLNDYGKLNGKLMQLTILFRELKDLNKNILVTALEMFITENKEEGGVIDFIYPMINAGKGKFSKRFVGEADIVGRMEITEKEGEIIRYIRTTKAKNIVAKDRIFKRKFCKTNEIFKKGEK